MSMLLSLMRDRGQPQPSTPATTLIQRTTPEGDDFLDVTYGIPEGYTTRDSGTGLYEILDSAGAIVGTGYDDIDTTLTEYQRQNVMGSASSKVDESYEYGLADLAQGKTREEAGTRWESPYLADTTDGSILNGLTTTNRQFATQGELNTELEGLLAKSPSLDSVYGPSTINATTGENQLYGQANRWEALGIMANPGVAQDTGSLQRQILGRSPDAAYTGNFGDGKFDPGQTQNEAAYDFVGLPNTSAGNAISSRATEQLSGANALTGSTPVFRNGQLIGYSLNTQLMSTENQAAIDEILKNSEKNYSVGDAGLATSEGDKKLAYSNTLYRELSQGWDDYRKLSDTEYFVPLDKVSEVPGWTNHSDSSFYRAQETNWVAIAATVALSFFGAPMLATALTPTMTAAVGAGAAGAAAGAASGAVFGTLGAGMTNGNVGTGLLTGIVGGGIGGYTSSMGPVGKAIGAAAGGAASAAIRGGDVGQGALIGVASSAANSAAGGGTWGSLAGSGTSMLLSSYLNQPDAALPSSIPAATSSTPNEEEPIGVFNTTRPSSLLNYRRTA